MLPDAAQNRCKTISRKNYVQEISNDLMSEFSDIPDVAQITHITLRLLVAMGAALFVLIPQQLGASHTDLSRVLQDSIAAVGFLGAGSIILGNKEVETRGLTTAAGIWVTEAIGVAAELGRESTAVLRTLIALFVLSTIPGLLRVDKSALKR
ncbi:MAG: MgtC/SapB family protein [Rhodoferax sp.]|nr:MgtC/SapB family protein [Rhodoferax sp.]